MFAADDYVVSSNQGICRITEIAELDLMGNGNRREYYILVPVEDQDAKLYIPVDSDKHRIRKVMTEKQAMELLSHMSEIEETWIVNDKQREQQYREAIFSCDPRQLISILKTMYMRNQTRSAEGKKITVVDDRYYKLAEKTLFAELAFAMGREKAEMPPLVRSYMTK